MDEQTGLNSQRFTIQVPRLRWRWRILLVLLCLGGVLESRSIVASWGADKTLPVSFRPASETHMLYAVHDATELHLTVWEPLTKPNGRMVLFFHAGGWITGSRRTAGPDSILLTLCEQGYVIASADYRLVDACGTFPANLRDCRAALEWCQTHASDYGADPSQVILMGASAGAHLAAITAAATPDRRWDRDPRKFTPPALVVGIYGIYDFTGCALSESPDWIRAMVVEDSLREPASPQSWISPADPPVILLAAEDDRTTPYVQSRDYALALWAAGIDGSLLTVKHADHKFEPAWGTPSPNAEGRRTFIVEEIDRLLTETKKH